MRYQIKDFQSWKSNQVNEGIIDALKNISNKFIKLLSKFPGLSWLNNKFEGPGSWNLNMAMKSKTGELPTSLYLYTPPSLQVLADVGIEEAGKTPVVVTEEEPEITNEAVNIQYVKTEHPNPSVPNCTYDEFVKQVEARILDRRNNTGINMPPLFVWGAIGIGKTSGIESLAQKFQMQSETIPMATFDPDLIALPEKNPRTGKMSYIILEDIPCYDSKNPEANELHKEVNGVILSDGTPSGGILFFDELSRAPKRNQSVAISFIQDRKLGRWKMGDAWTIVGAANRPDDDPDLKDMVLSPALTNRFQHINVVPDIKNYEKFVLNYKDLEGNLVFDPIILEFLKFNKELLHRQPDEDAIVFPTSRSWKNAADAVYAFKQNVKNWTVRDIELIVSGCVGADVARTYFAFVDLVKSIDVKTLKAVYSDPSKADLPPKEGKIYVSHITNAMITAIIMDRKGEKLKESEILNLAKYAARLDNPTYATILIRMLLLQHPYLNPKSPKDVYDAKYADTIEKAFDILGAKYPGMTLDEITDKDIEAEIEEEDV